MYFIKKNSCVNLVLARFEKVVRPIKFVRTLLRKNTYFFRGRAIIVLLVHHKHEGGREI